MVFPPSAPSGAAGSIGVAFVKPPMSLPPVIPLFPLAEVVLFPRVGLPLHIFEPRYRKMVKDALEGERTIGMTLLKVGYEDDYAGRPPVFPLGCAGRIEDVHSLPDGRYNILLRGVARFRIVEERPGEPYRLALVEELPDVPADGARASIDRERVLSAVAAASSRPMLVVVQPDVAHDLFVNTLAQMLPLDPVEKLSLLECDSVSDRFERLLEILEFKRLTDAWGRPLPDRAN